MSTEKLRFHHLGWVNTKIGLMHWTSIMIVLSRIVQYNFEAIEANVPVLILTLITTENHLHSLILLPLQKYLIYLTIVLESMMKNLIGWKRVNN